MALVPKFEEGVRQGRQASLQAGIDATTVSQAKFGTIYSPSIVNNGGPP